MITRRWEDPSFFLQHGHRTTHHQPNNNNQIQHHPPSTATTTTSHNHHFNSRRPWWLVSSPSPYAPAIDAAIVVSAAAIVVSVAAIAVSVGDAPFRWLGRWLRRPSNRRGQRRRWRACPSRSLQQLDRQVRRPRVRAAVMAHAGAGAPVRAKRGETRRQQTGGGRRLVGE